MTFSLCLSDAFSCLDSGFTFLAATLHFYCPVPNAAHQELHGICLITGDANFDHLEKGIIYQVPHYKFIL